MTRFGSTEALVVACLRARDERRRAWLTERIVAAGDARERILATFDALDEWMAADNPRGCAMVNAYAEIADPDHPARRVGEERKAWLRGLYAELAADAVARDCGRAGGPVADPARRSHHRPRRREPCRCGDLGQGCRPDPAGRRCGAQHTPAQLSCSSCTSGLAEAYLQSPTHWAPPTSPPPLEVFDEHR